MMSDILREQILVNLFLYFILCYYSFLARIFHFLLSLLSAYVTTVHWIINLQSILTAAVARRPGKARDPHEVWSIPPWRSRDYRRVQIKYDDCRHPTGRGWSNFCLRYSKCDGPLQLISCSHDTVQSVSSKEDDYSLSGKNCWTNKNSLLSSADGTTTFVSKYLNL